MNWRGSRGVWEGIGDITIVFSLRLWKAILMSSISRAVKGVEGLVDIVALGCGGVGWCDEVGPMRVSDGGEVLE